MGTSGGGGGGGSLISVTCWAEADCSNAGTCTATSSTKTLTVPGGNTGTIKFSFPSGYATHQYSKNGGAFTTVAANGTVVFANNDTLAMKFGSLAAGGGEIDVDVIDNDSGTTLCTVAFVNGHS